MNFILTVLLFVTINFEICQTQKRGKWKSAVEEVKSKAEAAESAAILLKYKCTDKTCGGRGLCYQDHLNRAACECYWQFYYGPHCDRPTKACDPRDHHGTLPQCATESSDCFSTYGLNNCRCETDWIGRACNIYMMGMEIDKGIGQVVLMQLEPVAGTIVDIFLGVLAHGDANKYKLIVEGVAYDIDMQNFHLIDTATIAENITHFYGNESLCK